MSSGETITIFVFRTDNLGSISLNFARISLVGYLVDASI